MIYAVARTQNGSMIEGVEFDWEVTEGVDPIEDDPSDDTMTNTVTAEEAGTATLRVTAMGHNISADIMITVTGKPDRVLLTVDGADEPSDTSESPHALQIGDTVDLVASVKNGVNLRGGNFGWSSDDDDVAEVVAAGDNKSDNKAENTITATGRGSATITVTFEGAKVGEYNVRVSGSRNDRVLSHIIAVNTFKAEIPADAGASTWAPATITVEAILEDADGDPLNAKAVTAAITGGYSTGDFNPTLVAASVNTGMDGTATFTINAPAATAATGATGLENIVGDNRAFTLTLKSAGANDEVIIIKTMVTDARTN